MCIDILAIISDIFRWQPDTKYFWQILIDVSQAICFIFDKKKY